MPYLPLHSIPQPAWIAIGILLIILGLSFCYKGWNAMVLGRIHYWSGFLPFTIVSPWFIHLPPSERSLIKTKEGLLCHALIGPLFFLTAIPLIVAGLDLTSLGGTKALNFVLNAGDSSKPEAVRYSPPLNYQFPLAVRASKSIAKLFNVQIEEESGKRMLPKDRQTQYQQF
ncbi:MAG: hypothetical protein SGJ27_14435 [Candidatus Melainabacteria bacterium]|nr:hypothetical protein [Candidatus Melainabacteria bacterium]